MKFEIPSVAENNENGEEGGLVREAGPRQRENLGRAMKLMGEEYSVADDPALMRAFLEFTPEQSDAVVDKLESVLKTAKTRRDRQIDCTHWMSWVEEQYRIAMKEKESGRESGQ